MCGTTLPPSCCRFSLSQPSRPAPDLFFLVASLQAAVLALAPAAMVSRRFTQKARDIFIRKINAGGLVLLNEASYLHHTRHHTCIVRPFYCRSQYFSGSYVFMLLCFRFSFFLVLVSFFVFLGEGFRARADLRTLQHIRCALGAVNT